MRDQQPVAPLNNFACNPQSATQLLKGISAITQIINQPNCRFRTRLQKILATTLDYLDAEQGSIMTIEGKTLVVQAASRRNLVGHRQPLKEESIASWVAKSKKPLFIADISQDNRFKGRGKNIYRKEALLSVPILQASKLLGIINVSDKSGDHDLLKEDATYLLEFGTTILSTLVQQQLQVKLKRQKSILRKRNLELRRQENLREELSGLLIHDLKAPLSEIVANLDIISYSITGESQDFLEAAQISCDRTVRMVNNLVAINKIEDGKMQLYREETEIADLLKESYSATKGLAKIKEVKLNLQIPTEDLPTLHLDRVIILRVLQNLMVNAIGYTTPGTEITMGCTFAPQKDVLEFFVEDQGPGITPERQKTIFDKYTRISDKKDNLIGTGLGLYFCKLAIDIHKGKIGIASSPSTGSRFFFTLPF